MKKALYLLIFLAAIGIIFNGCERALAPSEDLGSDQSDGSSMLSSMAKKGPHNKTTGDVGWINQGQRYAMFNAHDISPGTPSTSDRGNLYYEWHNHGTFTMKINWVNVKSETEAVFKGTVTSATGDYTKYLNGSGWGYVIDGGEPGIGYDQVRFGLGSGNPTPKRPKVGQNILNNGNLQIHYH